MASPRVRITRADRKVLREYGITMLHVQLFELSLLGLVQAQQPEPPDTEPFETTWKRVEELFKLPAGWLKQRAKIDDAALAADLESAVTTRNSLAHQYLLQFRLHVSSGLTTHEQEQATLRQAARNFDAVRQKLDELTEQVHRARGIDATPPEFTAAELRSIFAPGEPK